MRVLIRGPCSSRRPPLHLVVIAGEVGANQSCDQSRKIVTFDKRREFSSSIAELQSFGCIERDGIGKKIELRPGNLYLTTEDIRRRGRSF